MNGPAAQINMLRPPPSMLGVALLFWGWRSGMLWFGAAAGILLELSNAFRARWDFSDSEFNRLWDICTILFLLSAAYLRFSEDVTSAAYKFFQWMPLIFFPMALGHLFSARELVPLKAFSWFLRRKNAEGANRGVAFGWIYFGIILLSTSATNVRDIWFFVGTAALLGVALWCARPGRIPAWAWCIIFLVIVGAAFYGQSRLQEVQAYLENKASELFVRLGHRDWDPHQNRTGMGRIGELKQSSRIVMKVKPEFGRVPELLRECTYSKLENNVWIGSGRSFDSIPVEPDATTWNIYPSGPSRAAVRIIGRAGRKTALLPLPLGTVQLKDLTATAVETNRYQVVQSKGNPGLLNFAAYFGDYTPEGAPWSLDREIPEEEEAAIKSMAKEIDVRRDAPPEKIIAAIVRFFEQKFRYTTYQEARALGIHASTPLSDFLLRTRAGHCEYFASATVLLLREFHIPARYAIGYAVQEPSKEDDTYVIRERHGHAWAIAYIHKRWVEVDSTPAGWELAEEKEFPFYEGFADRWASLSFGLLEWRWLGDWTVFRMIAPWLAVPMIAFLAWRIFGRRMSSAVDHRESRVWPGADSDFFHLERKLAKAGLARLYGESTAVWLGRVREEQPGLAEILSPIMSLHLKYRFDPEGLSDGDRDELRSLVRRSLPLLPAGTAARR
jgi:transglutaminase-like putative cysteine protease